MTLELLDNYKAGICKCGTGTSGSLLRQVFVNMALELLDHYKTGICEYGTGTSGSL
jgi:hypothetical protein